MLQLELDYPGRMTRLMSRLPRQQDCGSSITELHIVATSLVPHAEMYYICYIDSPLLNSHRKLVQTCE